VTSFVVDISSSWVKRSLYAELQLPMKFFSLLVRSGGWPAGRAGGRLEESKIRLTQPSLAGTGAELGNILKR
jgi:hypothetical protein